MNFLKRNMKNGCRKNNNKEEILQRILDIEDLIEMELDQLHHYYEQLAQLAKNDLDIHTSHSIDAAKRNHDYKYGFLKKKHEEWLHKNNKPSLLRGFVLLQYFKYITSS